MIAATLNVELKAIDGPLKGKRLSMSVQLHAITLYRNLGKFNYSINRHSLKSEPDWAKLFQKHAIELNMEIVRTGDWEFLIKDLTGQINLKETHATQVEAKFTVEQ